MLDFGMEPQMALDAPRFSVYGVDSAEGPGTVRESRWDCSGPADSCWFLPPSDVVLLQWFCTFKVCSSFSCCQCVRGCLCCLSQAPFNPSPAIAVCCWKRASALERLRVLRSGVMLCGPTLVGMLGRCLGAGRSSAETLRRGCCGEALSLGLMAKSLVGEGLLSAYIVLACYVRWSAPHTM